ncbi:hypothetical protein [Azospirillum sp. TSO5]|uniref:hypothetical protein n=1 Tax=Azospirillum sp. TSO5 TaxID=716760 RepID=UPI000D658B28|nr:hypothetical protein [Azospirillum sp. TSO5]
MATERREIVTVLTVDASQLRQQADAAAAVIDSLGQKIVRLADGTEVVQTTLDNGAKATRGQKAALESLLTAMDPLYAAQKKIADTQEVIRKAMQAATAELTSNADASEKAKSAAAILTAKSKELSDIQLQLTTGLISGEDAIKRVSSAMTSSATATKLSYESQQILRSGIINTFQSISAGLPVGQVLLTQTTQTAPAFVEMAKGAGLSTTALVAFAAPAALAAGAIGAIALKLIQTQTEMRAFNVALKAGGDQAKVTADQLEAMVKTMQQKGVSRSDAVTILSGVSSIQQPLDASQIKQIADLAPDMAVKFGDAGQAFQKAVGYLTAGLPGIKAAYEETQSLSLAQYEAARAAFEHGNRGQALQIVLDGLKAKFAGLHQDSLGPAQKAMEGLKTSYDELATAAATHPITIKVAVEMSEGLQWVARFIKDPLNTEFPTFGLKGALGGEIAPLNSNPRGPSEGALTGNYRPSSSYPSAPAGTPVPGVKPSTVDGMTPKELGELSDLRHANDLLAEAMKKVGAARQVAVAGAQAYIAAINGGKSPQAAQNAQLEAERMARVQLSASIADQTAQITIQARESLNMADAYMQSAAAGERASAMRQAQLDSLQSGIDVEARYRQILNERAATQAATSAQALQTYQQEVAGREAVANATMEGVDAAYKAEMAEKVRVGTLAETIALENASGEAAEKLRKIIEAKTAAILDDERAQRKQQVAQAIQQQKDQLELGQAQLRLMGASAEQRAVEIARLQALVYLRNQHIDALSAEGQAYIANAENIARQSLETERLQAAYQELERFGDQAFSSIVDAAVKGGDATSAWKNAVKGLATEFETLAAKMLLLNPIKNAVFGSNLPTIFDFGSMGGGSAANQNGGMGGLGGQALSLGSKFLPTGGITAAIDSWGYSALGLGTPLYGSAGLTSATGGLASSAGVAAVPGGVTNVAATPSVTGVSAGTGLSAYLGAAGIGFGVGSMLPSLLNIHSKLAGGAVGGLGGAGAGALAGTFLFPGVGTLLGAILGGGSGFLGGLLGTQKPSVGKTASSDVTISSNGKSATYGNILTDNEGDPEAGRALGQYISSIFTTAAAGGGKLTKDFGFGQTAKDGYYIAGSVDYKKFGDDFGALMRYALIDQGGLKDGGKNTLAAITNSKNKDAEEFGKDVALGAGIDAGNTALKEMVKTLAGVTDAAKKATTESFKPMFEELERAKKLGIDGAYKDLATDQLKAYLDQLRNPPDFTQVQTDMATLTGQFQAARDAYAQLNPAMVTYVDQIEKETRARVAANLNKSLDQQINEANGRGYVNQINGLMDNLSANARSLAAVGEPAAKANDLYNASLTSLLKTLTTDQLGDVARTFGGDIATLANSITTAATATQQATRFEELFSQIRQQNIQEDISNLNEQINVAKSAQSQWQNLLTSVGNFRASLLTGDLSPLSAKDKASESLSQFFAAVDKAKGGDVDAAGQVQSLAQAALQANKAYYASSEDYARIVGQVQDGLGGVESVATRQVSLQASQLSTLQQSLSVQQSMLDKLQNQTSQTDISAVLSGLNAGNLGDLVRWGQRQGSDVLMQVLQTADAKLGQAGNNYRYRAGDDIMSIANHMGTDDYLSVGKSIGFTGGIDQLNPWIVAYNKQSAFETAVKAWGASHGYENGGVVGNGIYGVDSVIARMAGGGAVQLAGGEYVMPANQTAAYRPALDAMRAGTWGAANDRYSGNVLPFRGGQSGGSSNSDQGWKAVVSELQAMNRDQTDLGKAMVTELAQARRTNAALLEENRRLRQQLSDTEGKRQPRAAYK